MPTAVLPLRGPFLRVELQLLALAQASNTGALERGGMDELHGARIHGNALSLTGVRVGFGARDFAAIFPVCRFWREVRNVSARQ